MIQKRPELVIARIFNIYNIHYYINNITYCFYSLKEEQKNELIKLNDQMKNVVDIKEYKILKHDFEELTTKHREILHFALFKVIQITFINIIFVVI